MVASLLMMMHNMMMFAEDEAYLRISAIRIMLFILVMMCSVYLIAVVLLQPGNHPALGHRSAEGRRPFSARTRQDNREQEEEAHGGYHNTRGFPDNLAVVNIVL